MHAEVNQHITHTHITHTHTHTHTHLVVPWLRAVGVSPSVGCQMLLHQHPEQQAQTQHYIHGAVTKLLNIHIDVLQNYTEFISACVHSILLTVLTQHSLLCAYKAFTSLCVHSIHFSVRTQHSPHCAYTALTSPLSHSIHLTVITQHSPHCDHTAFTSL